ncbi:RNA-binding protein [Candidatus Pacearchaeota archaeon CG10_big_fil_rev_8_21_14_0_10_32_14]|nr:MAG: RNA-binding protein [Candidatus Pacearchaeota archaeon CG10_big_fil_rev_8_21_14_0_10_32_14]
MRNEEFENEEIEQEVEVESEKERKVVIPGEVIVKGHDYLPGENTEKRGDSIVALRYGLAEEFRGLVKVIPLSGIYTPRRGNVVLGIVSNLTFNGWVIDVGAPDRAFLPLMEVPRFVNKNDIAEVMDIGDAVAVKIWSVKRRSIDLSIKSRGLGKLEDGMIFKINPNKVPRVIGREGSMVSLIKEETGCNITVGQNGYIWIKGEKVEDEILAKNAIMFITERSFVSGLTDKVKEWFDKQK